MRTALCLLLACASACTRAPGLQLTLDASRLSSDVRASIDTLRVSTDDRTLPTVDRAVSGLRPEERVLVELPPSSAVRVTVDVISLGKLIASASTLELSITADGSESFTLILDDAVRVGDGSMQIPVDFSSIDFAGDWLAGLQLTPTLSYTPGLPAEGGLEIVPVDLDGTGPVDLLVHLRSGGNDRLVAARAGSSGYVPATPFQTVPGLMALPIGHITAGTRGTSVDIVVAVGTNLYGSVWSVTTGWSILASAGTAAGAFDSVIGDAQWFASETTRIAAPLGKLLATNNTPPIPMLHIGELSWDIFTGKYTGPTAGVSTMGPFNAATFGCWPTHSACGSGTLLLSLASGIASDSVDTAMIMPYVSVTNAGPIAIANLTGSDTQSAVWVEAPGVSSMAMLHAWSSDGASKLDVPLGAMGTADNFSVAVGDLDGAAGDEIAVSIRNAHVVRVFHVVGNTLVGQDLADAPVDPVDVVIAPFFGDSTRRGYYDLAVLSFAGAKVTLFQNL